jgi:DNA polymerase III subunit delta
MPDSPPGPLPVVLIKGDDPALVAEAVRAATDAGLAGDDRGLALEEIGGDDASVGAIVDAAMTPPFLTARRVIVVRDIGQWSTDQLAPLIDYLGHPEATASLVLVAGGGQTSQRLLNAVKKAGQVIDAGAPTGRARTSWVTDRLRHAPVRFDAAAGARLAEHLGEDLGRLASLVDVLVSAYGEGAHVGVPELEPFLGSAGGVAPWDLTDAIDGGDTAGALAALARMGDRHPLVVLASLHRHYAAMLRLDGSGITSEADAAAAVGMAPYPAKKAMLQANRLGSVNVARAIRLVAAADLDLRGLKDWPDGLVLEVLVARLSRLVTARPRSRVRA